MVKKAVMGTMVNQVMKDIAPDIPPGKAHQVENEVINKLNNVLGENWATLPVTGPYMMISVLVLNYILLPMGITPVRVADRVLSKTREYDIDTRFQDLLFSAKATAHATGEFTTEKLRELSDYSEDKTSTIRPKIRELVESGQELGKSVVSKGKSLGKGLVGSIKNRFDRDDEQDHDSEDNEE